MCHPGRAKYPGAIGKGVSVIAKSDIVMAKQLEIAENLLKPLGTVIGPVDEKRMSVVTGLSGSGPVSSFLPRRWPMQPWQKAFRPIWPSSLRRSPSKALRPDGAVGRASSALRKAVTSPGGTTRPLLTSSWMRVGYYPDAKGYPRRCEPRPGAVSRHRLGDRRDHGGGDRRHRRAGPSRRTAPR